MQGAVGGGEPGDVVPAALDAEQQSLLARELHARDDVRRAEAADHERRAPVDHRVPDGPGVLVAWVTGKEQGALEPRLQALERGGLNVDGLSIQGGCVHVPLLSLEMLPCSFA